MRYLTSRTPEISHILLVESGSRSVMEASIPRLRHVFGSHIALDLVTCYPGAPAALDATSRIWRTQDFVDAPSRARLLAELKSTGASVLAIVCSNEAIMSRWKWWLVWKLPAKVLIVNENADCFWLDTANLGTLGRFALLRAGLSGEPAGRTLLRCAAFPFVLAYLLLYATIVHARRRMRLTFGHHG